MRLLFKTVVQVDADDDPAAEEERAEKEEAGQPKWDFPCMTRAALMQGPE